MYKSPIDIAYKEMELQIEKCAKQLDEDIYTAIMQYDIIVDEKELLRALQYDRNQYEKGYSDGKADAIAELVRCKDCKMYGNDEECPLLSMMQYTEEADFCSCGERKDNGECE